MGTPHDAALGLPLVMTGPDSTRTLDNLTKWGVRLYGPDEDGDYEWRSQSGRYFWGVSTRGWLSQSPNSILALYSHDLCVANPPTRPPPDWQPHDGTKPGPTTPCRTDAASLDEHAKSVEGRRYAAKTGAVMKNVMEARARMWGLLATEEEHAAFRAWEEAINLWIDHIIEGGV